MIGENLSSVLVVRAAEHPDRVAIVGRRGGRSERVTYGELRARVEALAVGMRAAGLRPGDRVLLFVPMSVDLYTLLLAAFHAGLVAVFVDAWADRRRLDATVAEAAPKLFVGSPRAHALRLLSRRVRGIPRHWVVGRGPWSLRRRERSGGGAPEPVPADHPALITFTTGSTGEPKAAVRTHGFLWAQHQELQQHLGLRPDDIDMPTLPVFVLNNLASGIPSVLPGFDPRRPAEIDAAAVHRQMRAEGVSTSVGSPAFYRKLAEWCLENGTRIPVRALWTGGAPVTPPLARLLERATQGVAHAVYGSTEAEPIAILPCAEICSAMQGARPQEGLCVGDPVSGLTLRLVRPHDDSIELGPAGWLAWEVPPGEVGEVVVTGPHVLGRYWNQPHHDRRFKVVDGARVWHRTGDAARRDGAGRLWLMGRVSERVRRSGETWWGGPAELAALSTPDVSHAALLGEPDPALGERTALCLETPRGGPLPPTVEAALRERLRPMPLDRIVTLPRIPRDPRHASKTDMARLKQLLRSSS